MFGTPAFQGVAGVIREMRSSLERCCYTYGNSPHPPPTSEMPETLVELMFASVLRTGVRLRSFRQSRAPEGQGRLLVIRSPTRSDGSLFGSDHCNSYFPFNHGCDDGSGAHFRRNRPSTHHYHATTPATTTRKDRSWGVQYAPDLLKHKE